MLVEDDQAAADGEPQDQPEASIVALSAEMVGLLGPVADLALQLDQLAVFPAGPQTPPDAVLTDLSVGVGTPAPDGRVDAQIAATVTTSISGDDAARLLTGSLIGAGYVVLDSSESGSQRSTSFRVPGGNRFDELVVAVSDTGEATAVRLVYGAPVPTSRVRRFVEWSGGPLPLPDRGDRRTLVVATRSGQGVLETTRWTVETSAIVDGGDLQAEADRLLARIEDSGGPWSSHPVLTAGSEAPLTGGLRHPGLDDARYEVVPVQRVGIDRSGELASVPGIEVRVVGERIGS